ncbi:hypothetical protein [Glaciihabitans sp. dw_435]|uniref:hypothetical protein n=1 Tax=Glaciihabitans sp. dw_435 TaxID=2720081 RepID=UPI001BD5047C|nr:hypothetical protein [Glaciihabitans sp. dw_435]
MRKRLTLTIIGFSALALGLAALVSVIAWHSTAAAQRAAVLVYPDARAYICDAGTTLLAGWDEGSDATFSQSVASTKDMDCDLRFHVVNTGTATVELASATYILMGPDTGVSAMIDRIDGQPPVAGGNRSDARQVMPYPESIEPGEEYLLVAHMIFNPNGCDSEGGFETFDSPIVTISALGLSGTRQAGYGTYSISGTPDSEC